MRTVHVGMWCLDTLTKQNLSTPTRITMLAQALESFHARCVRLDQEAARQGHGPDRPHRMRGIFIAPENLFSRPLTEDRGFRYGDVRQVSERQKNEIVGELKVLSRRYPDLLIIPGSISWKKSIDRPEGADRPWWKQVATPNPFAVLAEPQQSRRAKGIARITTNAQTLGVALHTGYSEPFGFSNENTPALTPQQKLDHLQTATSIAKNTSYALFNGEVLLKYNKSSDFHEVLDGGDTVFIPGDAPGRFSCDGIAFGLDICMDNNYACLQQDAGSVDVHILISAATEGEAQHANIVEGGWFIHCSSNTLYYELNQKGFGTMPSENIEKLGDLRCAGLVIFENAQEAEQMSAMVRMMVFSKLQEQAQARAEFFS